MFACCSFYLPFLSPSPSTVWQLRVLGVNTFSQHCLTVVCMDLPLKRLDEFSDNAGIPRYPSTPFLPQIHLPPSIPPSSVLIFCLQDEGDEQEERRPRPVQEGGQRPTEAHRRRHQTAPQPHRAASRLNRVSVLVRNSRSDRSVFHQPKIRASTSLWLPSISILTSCSLVANQTAGFWRCLLLRV